MPNTRETLINLIVDAKRTDPETGSFTEWLADHLIANGVTLADQLASSKQVVASSNTPEEKPQTNADRIRAMSDEELAEFISSCGCPDHAKSCMASCTDCTLKWLKQPAEESL